jgi:hypothetical protein
MPRKDGRCGGPVARGGKGKSEIVSDGQSVHGPCMNDDDFRNLEHDVGRHEGDLDKQLKEIQELKGEIHALKERHSKEIQSLKEDFRQLVDLVRLLGIGAMDPTAESDQTLEKGRHARDDFRWKIQRILQKYECRGLKFAGIKAVMLQRAVSGIVITITRTRRNRILVRPNASEKAA